MSIRAARRIGANVWPPLPGLQLDVVDDCAEAGRENGQFAACPL